MFDYVQKNKKQKNPQRAILLHRGNKPSDLETTLGNEAINQQLRLELIRVLEFLAKVACERQALL